MRDPADPAKMIIYWATVGDVALAVSVHLSGGNPFEFGFGPPGGMARSPGSEWVTLGAFGFADETARQAAYRKARAWLATAR